LLVLGIIWAIAGLNIIGIRENARVTFGIFVAAAFVFVNLIALGVLNIEPSSPARMWQSGVEVYQALHHHTLAHAVSVITIGVASCVLAYSGIESVIQTAGLVESWRDIAKAYWFLALTFCINVGCLLIYRYFQGTKEIREYHTSRTGTLLLELILVACFIYLALHKPYGTGLWAAVVTVLLAAGIPFSRRYGPEAAQVRRSDYPMEMLLALGEVDGALHVYFRRPGEVEATETSPGSVYITFFSPRRPMPERVAPNHYRFPIAGGSLYRSIQAILELLQEELDGREVHVHFGWPTSSWLDRMAVGVF